MTWLLVVLLAVLTLLAMAFALKVPRTGRTAVAAALLLGLAGYALQNNTGLPGSPTAPRIAGRSETDPAVEARQALSASPGGGNKWLVIADAMARNGDYANAAAVLRGAVEHDPDDADAWLAMANALVSHADGQISPAALLAYRRAKAAAPDSPGPPFFLGLALAQSGRAREGRAEWAELLARSPADAPWRADLASRLEQLDAFIAAQESRQGAVR